MAVNARKDGDLARLDIQCPVCTDQRTMTVMLSSWEEFCAPSRDRLISEIFQDLSAEDREALVSGTCASCWDILYAEGTSIPDYDTIDDTDVFSL